MQLQREWKLKEVQKSSDEESSELLSFSVLTQKVLKNRGVVSHDAIQKFLRPQLKDLTSPWKMKDMDVLVQRLIDARENGEPVRVFGDYDVDGTCGAALLSHVFRELEFTYDAIQPDRFKDGYGLNVGAVEQAADDGISVLVTVDCGISSFDAALKAQELGIDLLVIDHHQLDPVRGLPQAVAIVNPQRPDCESELKMLCGCGLAFYVAMALRAKGRDLGWPEPNLKNHLDLVVLATAADMVPLVGDNRILVKHGLEVLKQTSKPGFKALMDVAKIEPGKVSPGHLGFTLGPRINASGRLDSAGIALELLTTLDEVRGLELANILEGLNQERMDLQNAIWDQVRESVAGEKEQGLHKNGIVVWNENWHEGVVGIVASRVTEHFHQPAIVLSIRDHGDGNIFAKGSARTFAGKNVLEAIRAGQEFLLGFGGHKHAAGLSLKVSELENFRARFDQAVSELPDTSTRELLIDAIADLNDFSVKTLSELETLAPFGTGNPEPVFQVKAHAGDHRILKERHLKFELSENNVKVDAIWFHAVDAVEKIAEGASAVWAGVPELNKFRGRVTPTFRVRDAKFDQ